MTVEITTSTGEEMLRSVTPIYNNDDLALAIFEANGKLMHEVGVVIEGLKFEMYPQNATWTLGYWEQMLGIKTNQNLPDADRVQMVLFELNKYFSITKKRMEIIVNAFVNRQDAFVEDVEGEYAFVVIIPMSSTIRNGLRDAVEETKPAHLLAIYERIAEVGCIAIKNDSYDYPVYYKTCGEFSGEKEFTQMEIGTINATDDTYDYIVEYPESVKEFTQVDLSPITAADDSYSYIKRFPVTGEMETLTKGHNTLHGTSSAAGDLYDYQATYPVCGEFYAEGDG